MNTRASLHLLAKLTPFSLMRLLVSGGLGPTGADRAAYERQGFLVLPRPVLAMGRRVIQTPLSVLH
jgi:hypothetical protein